MMPFTRSLRSSRRLVTFSSKVRNACLIYLPPSGNPPPPSLPASREPRGPDSGRQPRSEEHTCELQSRQYLVCRLLLEKKKKKTIATIITKTKNRQNTYKIHLWSY